MLPLHLPPGAGHPPAATLPCNLHHHQEQLLLPPPLPTRGAAARYHQQQQQQASPESHHHHHQYQNSYQQHQQALTNQFSCVSSNGDGTLTGAVAAAAARDADWLSQQLTDMQRLRHSLFTGLASPKEAKQTVSTVAAASLAHSTQNCQSPRNEEEETTNSASSTANTIDNRNPNATASSQGSCQHQQYRQKLSIGSHRHHSHHQHNQRIYRRSAHQSDSSSNSSSSIESTESDYAEDDGSLASSTRAVSMIVKKPAECHRDTVADTAPDATAAASNTAGAAPPTSDIEAMYAKFLCVSSKLSGLVAEYYASATNAAPAQQVQLQQQQQQLQQSQQNSFSKRQHSKEDGHRPALILPSPLRRSLESRRRVKQREDDSSSIRQPEQPQQPPPLPPHRQPQNLQPLKPSEQPLLQPPQQQQPSQRHSKRSKKFQRAKRSKCDGGNNCTGTPSKSGIGQRIRATLTRLSPRLKTQLPPPQLPSLPSQPPQPLAPVQENRLEATATTQGGDGSHNASARLKADSPVTLDTRIRLSVGAEASSTRHQTHQLQQQTQQDPFLLKLQRLRSTVLSLVQRSVDPVLQSLRDIHEQHHQLGDQALRVWPELTLALKDVMSLMELLSRSVMLVSMHNLDPNSLKLVYLSSSYIRSLKRISRSFFGSTGDLLAEEAGSPDRSQGR